LNSSVEKQNRTNTRNTGNRPALPGANLEKSFDDEHLASPYYFFQTTAPLPDRQNILTHNPIGGFPVTSILSFYGSR